LRSKYLKKCEANFFKRSESSAVETTKPCRLETNSCLKKKANLG
jgi:hypothetical protein